jgi:predicted ATP-binding protein involved in virulence
MELKSITVENFSCFEKITVDFDSQLTCLVGPNGIGKTSILRSIVPLLEFVAGIFDEKSISYNSIEMATGSRKVTPFERIDLPIGGKDDKISIKYVLDEKEIFFENRISRIFGFENEIKFKGNIEDIKDSIISKEKCAPVTVSYLSPRHIAKKDAILNESLTVSEVDNFDFYEDIGGSKINYQKILSWFDAKNSQEGINVRDSGDINFRLPELQLIRDVLSKSLLEYEKPNFDFETKEMTLLKKGSKLRIPVSRLGQGFQSIFLLVLDLAVKMISLNRFVDFGEKNALYTPAIVLIDEIEANLYPSWEQTVLPTLMEVFPKTQFIVTTNSPCVLTSLKPQNITILCENEALGVGTSTYGATCKAVLHNVFDIDDRPDNEARRALDRYFELINLGEAKGDEAVEIRNKLGIWMRDDPDLARADAIIRKKEIFKNILTKQEAEDKKVNETNEF